MTRARLHGRILSLPIAMCLALTSCSLARSRDAGPEAKAEAQAALDLYSPDYPFEIQRVTEKELGVGWWREWTVRARQDPKTTLTIRIPSEPDRAVNQVRHDFKVRRDGSNHEPYTPPPLPTNPPPGVNAWRLTHDAVAVPNFTNHDPYNPHRAANVDIQGTTPDLNSADIDAWMQQLRAWASTNHVPLNEVVIIGNNCTSQAGCDIYYINYLGWTSPTFSADLQKAKNSQKRAGLDYSRTQFGYDDRKASEEATTTSR